MRRSEQLLNLDQTFDVLIIGGGATGLGIAIDSASRGFSTLLVEARDFAQGTSSRSTKLIHGGVRYLERGDIKLVREALHERGRLVRNAPHIVHELRFLVPSYEWWQLPYYSAGLITYDLLAGRLRLSFSRPMTSESAAKIVPTVETDGLMGGVIYSDAQFNDTRLAMIMARTAIEQGATLLNAAPVRSLLKSRGQVVGAVVEDLVEGKRIEVGARAVINATGVFSDEIRLMDDPQASKIMAPGQGVHLVFDRKFLPSDVGILIPKTDDGRVVFILPWQGKTLAGTTDTELPDPVIEPKPLEEEVDFILRHVDKYLSMKPERSDILSMWAGLRPLVRPQDSADGSSTAALSRDYTLLESASGLVTITGGKWTTYRAMAEDTVDHVAGVAGLPKRQSRTADLKLYGAGGTIPRWQEFGALPAEIEHYESEFEGDLHPRLPYSMAMVAYVIDNEMPVVLEDVLSRRVRALYLDARAAEEVAPKVAELMAERQGHDRRWIDDQIAEFQALARDHYIRGDETQADG